MKVKAEAVDEAGVALGDTEETEFTFLITPVQTYSILSEQAQLEGCSVGEILQKAVVQYFRSIHDTERKAETRSENMPEPDMVIRRKKRRP